MDSIDYSKPVFVAEIGCNHKGDMNIAKELIYLAKECGADYAKFQKRSPKELLSEEQYHAPHPNPYHSYGDSYGKHREFLELSKEQHAALKSYCESIGIKYATSIWDVCSAREIIALKPDYIKIPSACNNNYKLLEILRDEFGGGIHISLGMTTYDEEQELLSFFKENPESLQRLVIYSCTSGYPVPFENVCLCEITRIRRLFGNEVQAVGFSGHHLGIAIDNAAFTLGATWIERHFTKDRTWKGTDHAASLEPNGLRKLVRDVNATFSSLKYKDKEILDIEAEQRLKLKNTTASTSVKL